MSAQLRAFRPHAPTQNLVVGVAASAVNLNYTLGTTSIRLCNVGTQTVFFLPRAAGDSTDATFGNAIPLPAGQTEVFTLPSGTVSISMIASATGSTVYSTIGEGS
jgi:hypothetical protein